MGTFVPLYKPILLEKKGRIFLNPKRPNKSLFSMKNCLLSGKYRLNLDKLVTCRSTSTLEKSGFMVKSRFKEEDIAILASIPTSLSKSCVSS